MARGGRRFRRGRGCRLPHGDASGLSRTAEVKAPLTCRRVRIRRSSAEREGGDGAEGFFRRRCGPGVDGLDEDALAGAGFAADQDGGVGVRATCWRGGGRVAWPARWWRRRSNSGLERPTVSRRASTFLLEFAGSAMRLVMCLTCRGVKGLGR